MVPKSVNLDVREILLRFSQLQKTFPVGMTGLRAILQVPCSAPIDLAPGRPA
tara:strand:- start:371 stop:526 length:156 start_codon:yes stop_codon:yes gene_type:complete